MQKDSFLPVFRGKTGKASSQSMAMCVFDLRMRLRLSVFFANPMGENFILRVSVTSLCLKPTDLCSCTAKTSPREDLPFKSHHPVLAEGKPKRLMSWDSPPPTRSSILHTPPLTNPPITSHRVHPLHLRV